MKGRKERMKHQLNVQWDVFDVFCLMESLARESSRDAKLNVYDEGLGEWENVSLGLDVDMYAAAYSIASETDISVTFQDGSRIYYTHWRPDELQSQGNESFENAVELQIRSYTPAETLGMPALSFAQARRLLSLSVAERLRRFYRAAASAGAAMYLTDSQRNGKLIRITATWMLDVYEDPIDVVIRFKNDGWFIFHNDSGISYARGDRFSEAQGLLNILQ